MLDQACKVSGLAATARNRVDHASIVTGGAVDCNSRTTCPKAKGKLSSESSRSTGYEYDLIFKIDGHWAILQG